MWAFFCASSRFTKLGKALSSAHRDGIFPTDPREPKLERPTREKVMYSETKAGKIRGMMGFSAPRFVERLWHEQGIRLPVRRLYAIEQGVIRGTDQEREAIATQLGVRTWEVFQ